MISIAFFTIGSTRGHGLAHRRGCDPSLTCDGVKINLDIFFNSSSMAISLLSNGIPNVLTVRGKVAKGTWHQPPFCGAVASTMRPLPYILEFDDREDTILSGSNEVKGASATRCGAVSIRHG